MTSTDPPARAGPDTTRRVIPLFRPYRGRVVIVVGLIVAKPEGIAAGRRLALLI